METSLTAQNSDHDQSTNITVGQKPQCQVIACESVSSHSIRRKWFMKMRKSISKLLNLSLDHGNGNLSICDVHYDIISHLMVCALCKRKLLRNHIYYISQVSRTEIK